MVCRRFLVSGRVQGVWFRQSTRQQAERLGISGHALNLADGRVEVLACGSDQSVDALAAWLWQGPDQAEVTGVDSEDIPAQTVKGFVTG